MLYVSRIAGINKWGITDSDDNVETVVTLSQLEKYILLGLQIEGVEANVRMYRGRQKVEVLRVRVYQDAAHSTAQRAKAIVMQGIDMRVKGGKILSVSWDSSRLKDVTTIKLSGYGQKCENFIFVSTPLPTTKVIIVVDDRVQIKKQTFKRVFNLTNVTLDIRNCTNPKTATYIYEEYYLGYNGMDSNVGNRILDNTDRQELWKAIDVVFHGRAHWHTMPMGISVEVSKKFEREFSDFANLKLELCDGQLHLQNLQIYANRIAHEKAFWRSNCQDYDTVKEKDEHVLHAIRVCVPCNYYKMTRFINFMEWFYPSDAIQSVFVELCNRANNWFLDEAEARGLLVV